MAPIGIARALIGTIVTAFALGGARVASAQTRVTADFNDDGVADLAVGTPLANDGNGTVSIFFGVRGLGFPVNTPTFTIPGTTLEHYGFALAVGDFDRNGRTDLAVGAPLRSNATGSVEIVRFVPGRYGSVEIRRTRIDQDGPGISRTGRSYDRFGEALATGDFDCDGYDDLAVGAPGDDGGAPLRAGAVTVFRGGGPNGLSPNGEEVWHQQRLGLHGIKAGDEFGFSLTAGDLNTDCRDDLVIGIPSKDRGIYIDEGAVAVLYHALDGLSEPDVAYLTQPSGDPRTARGRFGHSLAIGHFGDDGFPDLAIGAPRTDSSIGSVVIRAGFRGHFQYFDPIVLTDRFLSGDTFATREVGAIFGWTLTTGDFNRDGLGDLAVGVPGKTVDDVPYAGAVTVFYAAQQRRGQPPSFAGVQRWQQNEYLVRDLAEQADYFGMSLSTGDFNDDGIDDLAIGIPSEDVGIRTPVVDAGAVSVLYGSTIGITAEGNHLLVAAYRQHAARFGLAFSR